MGQNYDNQMPNQRTQKIFRLVGTSQLMVKRLFKLQMSFLRKSNQSSSLPLLLRLTYSLSSRDDKNEKLFRRINL